MWNRYCQLRHEAALRDHLGLSVDEWQDLPAEFVPWADQFYRLVSTHGQQDPDEQATRDELKKMIGA